MRFDAKKLHIIMIATSTVVSAIAAAFGSIGVNEGALLGASMNGFVPFLSAGRV